MVGYMSNPATPASSSSSSSSSKSGKTTALRTLLSAQDFDVTKYIDDNLLGNEFNDRRRSFSSAYAHLETSLLSAFEGMYAVAQSAEDAIARDLSELEEKAEKYKGTLTYQLDKLQASIQLAGSKLEKLSKKFKRYVTEDKKRVTMKLWNIEKQRSVVEYAINIMSVIRELQHLEEGPANSSSTMAITTRDRLPASLKQNSWFDIAKCLNDLRKVLCGIQQQQTHSDLYVDIGKTQENITMLSAMVEYDLLAMFRELLVQFLADPTQILLYRVQQLVESLHFLKWEKALTSYT